MAKKTAPLLPSTSELLQQLGERLRLARRRRRLAAKQVAERAGMAPMTLRSLERGGSGVTIGAYLAVMQVLGIEKDLDLLGQADPVGHQLQDARLPAHRSMDNAARQIKELEDAALPFRQFPEMERVAKQLKETEDTNNLLKQAEVAHDWIKQSGFSSSKKLADLLDTVSPLSKKSGR